MTKPKSKEFILKEQTGMLNLRYLNGKEVEVPYIINMCSRTFAQVFGFGVELGKSKRIRITIEPLD